MAKVTSGSFNSSSYSGRYYTISWSATQDTAKNQSTISWKIEAKGGSSSYYAERKVELIIDGVSVYSKSNKIYRYKGTVATGTTTITHNTNGSRSFTASFKAAVYYEAVNCTGSGSWDLTDIPRAATITECSNFADNATSTTIKYANNAGNSVDKIEACIATYSASSGYWVDNGASYRSVNKTGTLSYTFDFTKEPTILTNLRKLVTASDGKLKIRFYLKTTIGSTYLYHSVEKTFSLVDFEPIFNPTIIDVGTRSTALTGNPNTIIKGYNVINYDIGATARKEAYITNQRITCGANTSTNATGEISYVDSNVFELRAIDNRGTISETTVTLPMINYSPLTCRMSASIELEGETTSKISFTVNGEWWSGNFGAEDNSVELYYRLKTGNTYGEWVAITPSVNADRGTYSFSDILGGLDYQENYTIQVMACDKVAYNGVYSKEIPLSTTPVFDYDNTSFNLNVPLTFNGGIEQDYIVESGTSGIWTYEKWASGKAVCWGISTFNTTTNTAWHTTGVYIGATDTGRVNYPVSFIDKPVEMANLTTGALATWLYSKSANGAAATGIYNVARFGSNSNNATFYINFYIVGRWK